MAYSLNRMLQHYIGDSALRSSDLILCCLRILGLMIWWGAGGRVTIRVFYSSLMNWVVLDIVIFNITFYCT